MKDTPESIHLAFLDATKPVREPRFATWERAYYDFIEAGYTSDDIYTVASFIRRDNSRNNRRAGEGWQMTSAKVFDFDYRWFDSLLTTATADKRNRRPMPTPKDKIVALYQQTQNPDEAPQADTSVPIKDAIKKAVANL